MKTNRLMNWLVGQWHWPHAALFAGVFLLLLAPLWFHLAGTALGLVYLQLPIYMLHQAEEHIGDRFRLFFNRLIGGGREALTPLATFWINALGVWAVDVAALFLAVYVDLPLGLIAIYLPLVNALGHILPAALRRQYNPGLITSVVLFVPAGTWGLFAVAGVSGADWRAHALAAGVAVAVHAAIIVYVRFRLARLPR